MPTCLAPPSPSLQFSAPRGKGWVNVYEHTKGSLADEAMGFKPQQEQRGGEMRSQGSTFHGLL